MTVKGCDKGGVMVGNKTGTASPETRSPQGSHGHACAVTADGALAGSLWDRFGAWPPAARRPVAVLLSLMLWVAIWFGVRAALRDFG